jgi:glycosyltransferase involved in cell wall biosynthesis
VSVIVPVYNTLQFLGECLDSLLSQTYTDFEIICVNDGSTDGSLDLAKRYASKDERIVLISQENAGLSAARNAGIDHARGEYIVFVDSDDFAADTMLEKLINKADDSGAEIVIMDYYLYFNETGKLGTYRDQVLYAELDGKVFNIEEEPAMFQFIGVCDRMFRRDFIEEHGFRYPVGRIYEDVTFCIASELAAKKIALLADHLYYYRKDVASSITGQESKSNSPKDEFLYAQRCAQESMRKADASTEIWKYYSWYFLEYSMIHQRQVSSYSYFRYFFKEVRGIVRPEILSYGQKRIDAELFVYRFFLRVGWVAPSYLFLKGMNRLRYYAGMFVRRVMRKER